MSHFLLIYGIHSKKGDFIPKRFAASTIYLEKNIPKCNFIKRIRNFFFRIAKFTIFLDNSPEYMLKLFEQHVFTVYVA